MRGYKKTVKFVGRLAQIFFIILDLSLSFKISKSEKLRLFFERAGGGILRFGRILSLRSDFLSPRYMAELIKLMDNTPQTPFAKMQEVFTREMSNPVGKFFLDFSDDPIGSASIAHVYKAKLKDGVSVAVKIQRPDAEEIFESDFLVIIFLAQIFDFFKSTSFVSAVEVAHDFIRWTRHELDFRNEARNSDAFYKYSEGGYNAIIPKQYLNLTTKRVLVEEFVEGGILASKLINNEVSEEALERMSVSRDILAGNIMFEMMRQYFVDGFFHADAHPSNIMVLPENKIAFMGFGIVGEASANRLNLLKFLRAISVNNMEEATASLVDFGENSYQEEIELFIISARDKRGAAKKLFEKIKKVIIKDFSVEAEAILKPWIEAAGNKELSVAGRSSSSVFFRLIWEAEKYGIVFDSEVALFFRALAITEMVTLHISDDFDMMGAIRAFLNEYSLGEIEAVIKDRENELNSAKKEIMSVEDGDWEEFLELVEIQKERRFVAKERIMEIVSDYAETNEEIRSLLKSSK
ncbi:MAG: hypothetical protein COV02_01580 [Candidatus Terrybacteria bacterium CG10_big_fil_rev_8_21_14_0_10_41_10]|uniref:ABC1 atypical kinase-like domain-containing protein n=1 Tax=Candidatus Terrybacteria bacterium CG10_big_fil_rev_8_21_14_0_10_41_10 TaxID=1975026 RepID=A0A2M8LAG0_9BACT|nr:MAG: hypothetical protein COV02_01580 [Candidatus Terrybacteria bacterium CG10_big_fil_rev_8_21_14_0_10_41_10]